MASTLSCIIDTMPTRPAEAGMALKPFKFIYKIKYTNFIYVKHRATI
uniref:Uncharacterized protein n=1 Tax=viral metagenome TaxID=1070528 RepID=A0A6C0BYD3_9ZZZZ